MPTRSRILLYWLLLLLPTLVLGVWGWRLLVREDERIGRAAELARLERLSLTVENVDLFLEEVKSAVMEGLIAQPDDNPKESITMWRNENPFVRQVFIWRPGEALVYPDPLNPVDDDERNFVRRFQSLPDQRQDWPRDGALFRSGGIEGSPEKEKSTPASLPAVPEYDARPPSAASSPRREVQQLAHQDRLAHLQRERGMMQEIEARWQTPAPHGYESYLEDAVGDRAAVLPPEAGGPSPPSVSWDSEPPNRGVDKSSPLGVGASGWTPWHWEDGWSLIGWVEINSDGEVRGVELETSAIHSRLEILLEDAVSEGEILALLNGEGEAFYVAGGTALPAVSPAHTLPIGTLLPGWSVALYAGTGAAFDGGGFLLISLLSLGVFLAAILSGGSLLLWQAHSNALDARRKSGFVSNVSHELKTPLTTLRMYADLLADAQETDREKRVRYLGVIRSETERLTRLVNNVLDFSRMEREQKAFRLVTFDAVAFVEEMLQLQQPRISENGMSVVFKPATGRRIVRADRDALEQVCLNLLDNAIKYAANGGEIVVRIDERGDFLCIHFLDRGPGIPPEHRSRIFDEFHRVDDTLTAAHSGCGLGLSIARRLLRGQGGDLSYSPREGGGSVFSIALLSNKTPGERSKKV